MVIGFSYIGRFDHGYVGHLFERGHRVHDEDLFEAYEDLNPPLLAGKKHQNVLAILGGKRGRRFAMSCTAEEIAQELEQIDRPDLHPLFIPALATRLRKKRGFKRKETPESRFTQSDRDSRDWAIRSMYHAFMESIGEEDYVELEELGRLPVPFGTTRSERALEATQEYLAGKIPLLPAISTMRNIVSRG